MLGDERLEKIKKKKRKGEYSEIAIGFLGKLRSLLEEYDVGICANLFEEGVEFSFRDFCVEYNDGSMYADCLEGLIKKIRERPADEILCWV